MFRVVERQGLDNLMRERQIVEVQENNFRGRRIERNYPTLYLAVSYRRWNYSYDSNMETGERVTRTLGLTRLLS